MWERRCTKKGVACRRPCLGHLLLALPRSNDPRCSLSVRLERSGSAASVMGGAVRLEGVGDDRIQNLGFPPAPTVRMPQAHWILSRPRDAAASRRRPAPLGCRFTFGNPPRCCPRRRPTILLTPPPPPDSSSKVCEYAMSCNVMALLLSTLPAARRRGQVMRPWTSDAAVDKRCGRECTSYS